MAMLLAHGLLACQSLTSASRVSNLPCGDRPVFCLSRITSRLGFVMGGRHLAIADRAGVMLVACVFAGSMQASPFADKETQNYPDVKWGEGSDADVLYAASLDGSIDVYSLG